MANFYLFCTSTLFFIINIYIYINYYFNINKIFSIMSFIAAITSMLNHYYHNAIIRLIDRIFISIYVLYLYNLISNSYFLPNEKLMLNFLLISGVISILTAIRLRYLFENHIGNITITDFKCTLIHLYSHLILIVGYLIICKFIHNNRI